MTARESEWRGTSARPAPSRDTRRGAVGVPTAVRYFPIAFFQLFLFCTVLVFVFGAYDWPIVNPVELYSFLAVNQLALLWGYCRAIRGREPTPFSFPFPVHEFVWICTGVTLIMLVPITLVRTGGDINILRSLTNPGDAYLATHEAAARGTRSYAEYVGIVLSPLIWPLLPLTVTFWNRLGRLLKFMAVLAILGGAVGFFLIGTNKGLVDIFILTPWYLLLGSRSPGDILKPKRLFRSLYALGFAAIIFLPYFGLNIVTRGTTGTISATPTPGGTVIPRQIDIPGFNGPLANEYSAGLMALSSYVGQGYYGLSLCLQEPFVWTYGVGHSRFFIWLAEEATGQSYQTILDMTYPYRVARDFGWSGDTKWASLYPWIASDVSIFGVPIVMYLFGRLLALTWLDSIGGNPAALVLFGLAALTIYYASANPQVFQFSDTVVVFYVYLIWWLWTREPRTLRPRSRFGTTRANHALLTATRANEMKNYLQAFQARLS